MDEETTQRRSLLGPIVGAILIVLVVVWGAWMEHVGPFTVNTWSAVFLSDSEVFFGHVQSVSTDTIDMTNVFYLTKTSSSSTSTSASAQQLSLTGLVANQIQCPTDEIHINRQVVLYIQDLQANSYVVQQLARLTATPQTCFTPSSATAAPSASASETASPSASASATH